MLSIRSCSEPKHSMLEMRLTPTSEWQHGWLLGQEQPQDRLLQTCHPCCWTGASAILACRYAQPHLLHSFTLMRFREASSL